MPGRSKRNDRYSRYTGRPSSCRAKVDGAPGDQISGECHERPETSRQGITDLAVHGEEHDAARTMLTQAGPTSVVENSDASASRSSTPRPSLAGHILVTASFGPARISQHPRPPPLRETPGHPSRAPCLARKVRSGRFRCACVEEHEVSVVVDHVRQGRARRNHRRGRGDHHPAGGRPAQRRRAPTSTAWSTGANSHPARSVPAAGCIKLGGSRPKTLAPPAAEE